MADTTTPRLIEKPGTGKPKPRKPEVLALLAELGVRPDFELFPHQTRRWAKKIKGQLHYFGPWSNPAAALQKWKDERDDLEAGRTPRPRTADGLTVQDVVNQFLNAKASARQSGELSDRSFTDYHETCKRIIQHFGERRQIADLRPEDFGAFRHELAEKRGPVTLGNEIQRVRTVLKFAFDNDLIPSPVKVGTLFKKPSRNVLRIHKSTQPAKMFPAAELRTVLASADDQMKAMILLGINCGWGNKDVAGVREPHIDLKAGIATYARAKTGVDRRAPLWPETVKAVRKAIETRPKAKDEWDDDLIFVTRWGNPWVTSEAVTETDVENNAKVRRMATDSVGLEFGKLLRKVKVKRDGQMVPVKSLGLNFYSLRHTFKTIAEGATDLPAVHRIMGHTEQNQTQEGYREWAKPGQPSSAEEIARLKRVTDHVHAWLYPKRQPKKKK